MGLEIPQKKFGVQKIRQKNFERVIVAIRPIAPGRIKGFRIQNVQTPGVAERRLTSYLHASSVAPRRLSALRHLASASAEEALLDCLGRPQAPPLDADERTFIAEALERIGTAKSIPALANQRSDAAAWGLGRIGGPVA